MRTNIVIDDKLLNEAFLVSSAKTKKDLIQIIFDIFDALCYKCIIISNNVIG